MYFIVRVIMRKKSYSTFKFRIFRFSNRQIPKQLKKPKKKYQKITINGDRMFLLQQTGRPDPGPLPPPSAPPQLRPIRRAAILGAILPALPHPTPKLQSPTKFNNPRLHDPRRYQSIRFYPANYHPEIQNNFRPKIHIRGTNRCQPRTSIFVYKRRKRTGK